MKIKSKILILSLSSFIIASCVETPLVSEDTFSTQSGNNTSSSSTNTTNNNKETSSPDSNNNEPAPSSDDTGPDNPGTDDTGGNEGETGGQTDDTGGNDETGEKEGEYDLNNPVSLNVHNLTLYVNGTYQLNTQNKNNFR